MPNSRSDKEMFKFLDLLQSFDDFADEEVLEMIEDFDVLSSDDSDDVGEEE